MVNIIVPHNWWPRTYQVPLWDAIENGTKRAVAVWHRRAGKDITAFNITVKQALLNRVGLYWHLLPTYEMGRKIVWNGMTGEGQKFLDYWPPELIKRKRDDSMLLELNNGSIWQVVGSDDPNRLVGSNPVGVVFSEYSLQNPQAWEYVRPILAENKGWAIFIYTARGRNHGYDILQHAKKSDRWFGEILTVEDTSKLLLNEKHEPILDKDKNFTMVPVISQDAIDEDRSAGMAEEIILQEYWCSFDAPLTGAYYGDQMRAALEENRITKVDWEERLPVNTWWDLGIGDHNSIWFVQELGKEVRLIDYVEGTGKSLEEWIKVCKEKPYIYGTHLGPHDLAIREYTTGKSRWQAALDLGFRFEIVPKGSLEDGINEVRRELRHCYFDEVKCQLGIEALRQYRQEFDAKLNMYREKPVHDWSSHGSDAFRTGVMGRRNVMEHSGPKQKIAFNEINDEIYHGNQQEMALEY